jgi:hypothetical protein
MRKSQNDVRKSQNDMRKSKNDVRKRKIDMRKSKNDVRKRKIDMLHRLAHMVLPLAHVVLWFASMVTLLAGRAPPDGSSGAPLQTGAAEGPPTPQAHALPPGDGEERISPTISNPCGARGYEMVHRQGKIM